MAYEKKCFLCSYFVTHKHSVETHPTGQVEEFGGFCVAGTKKANSVHLLDDACSKFKLTPYLPNFAANVE